ncbi:UNVERIFIED_CONTAM: hypothetical protein HDU68_008081, partial [Siphonaria sp. JEL0065]
MSDRFFQSAPGVSSQGEMYFVRGAYVFTDNSFAPATSRGRGPHTCQVPFKFYHVGWPTSDDPTDDAFLYYLSLTNGLNAASIFVPFTKLATGISGGTLPAISYVKGAYQGFQNNGGQTEHPRGSISDGEIFNAGIINQILAGGFRDGQTPPPRSTLDNRPYGPRTPFIAVGNMVKKNYVSHTVTKPSSLVRFIESNWFADAAPGHLQTRDAIAGSLNDLFNQTA